MAVKFTNNAATTLAAGINSSATSISVTDGSVFPSLSSGEHFYCTFDDTTNVEIVKVTARSSNTLTVVRGQDNTTARAFSSGDKAELRVVAALLEDVKTEVTSTLSVDTFTGDDSTTAFTLSQAPASEDNLIVFIEGVYQNPGDFTLSGTTLTLDSAPVASRKIVVYHVSAAVSGNNLNHDQFTYSAGNAPQFTLSIAPIHENNTQVFIDGVYQQKDSYAVSGSTLTLDASPANGATVEVMTFTQTDVNTIPASFVAGLTEVSAVGTDHLLVYDATDNALKKALASDLIETVGATPTFTTANITNTTTGDSLLFTTTEDSSTAAPVITLKRNSGSPADADYLGQLKFKGENDADQEVIYAKITSKIQDASDGSEDGIIEFANIKAGSQTITARLKSDKLELLNSTGLEVAGDLTVDTSTLKVDSTNNRVGIGSASPNALLTVDGGNNDFEPSSSGTGLFHVRGGASSLYTAYIGVSDNGVQIGHTGNNRYLRFDTNETARMTILSDGKVGIGLTAPTKALEINDTSDVDGIQLRLKGDASYGGTMEFRRGDSFTWRAGVGGGSSTNSSIPSSFFGIEDGGDSLAFCIAHTTFRVGIGTNNPSNPLHVVAPATNQYPFRSANGQGYYYHGHGNASYHHNVQSGASTGFYFGSAAYANGGFHTYSDERLKENITNIDSALDKVALMNGVTFDWKDKELRGNGKQFGVIAQDMLKVDKELPDLVEDAEATQEEIDNKELNTQYYSMDYSRITPYLIEAIKELKADNDALKARIETLENA